MATEPQLETYLNALDKSLGQISASDRAEIIMEIKSHILDSQEKNPEVGLPAILDSLGDAKTVANRYLLERGLKISKPSKTPMVKWLTIGFLGTLSISLLFLCILLWKFTPLISVDDENDHVMILGGLIDINGKAGQVNVRSKASAFDEVEVMTIQGSKEIAKSTQKLSIHFSNGSFQLTSLTGRNDLKWHCQAGASKSPTITEVGGNLSLDFRKIEGTNCKIQLPANLASYIKGESGEVEIIKPKSAFEIQLDNGQILFSPDVHLEYKYQIQVAHGLVDHFVSSTSTQAIVIKMTLENGYINQEKI
jgi:hypothetical protein